MSSVVSALWPMWIALLGKVLTLIGAIAQTIGVITFFTLESLAPYRWPLILGGTALIAVSEIALQAFGRHLARKAAADVSQSGGRDVA